MARAFLIVMDSVGIGGAPDAETFFNLDEPDTGANTLAHIVQETGLYLPTLDALGLGAAVTLASGETLTGWSQEPTGLWGAATEVSRGKDTPSGHWELTGVPVPWDWHFFPKTEPAFPAALSADVARLAGTDGILGDCHASGTDIIARLGAQHQESGWPICYTSADSVFQIAAHEESFGLERLLQLCAEVAKIVHAYPVGRVIARPFIGAPGAFERTGNRRDFAMTPPAPTLLDWCQGMDRPVWALGKIHDIFAGQGIDVVAKGPDLKLMEELRGAVDNLPDGGLCIANFVEFDSLYGHRRDVSGYAKHLAWFDAAIADILPQVRQDDCLCITADHGNDPTWIGTDHTRERVPVLIAGGSPGRIGHCAFADVGASMAKHLCIPHQGPGTPFL